ncbi:MAG: ATP-binding protein [Candidatus Korobacteraceae bacterium]
MAPLSLKTKLVLAITGMVFALVAVFSFIYVSKVVRQRTTQAYQTADLFAKEILERAGDVTHVDAATLGADPSDPKAVDLAIAERLQHDPGLHSLFNSIIGFSDIVYDAAIADNDGRAIVDTNQNPIGTRLDVREDFDTLLGASLYKQLQVFYGPPRVYDHHVQIRREGGPFGDIRVGISTVLFKHEIQPQLIRALGFSSLAILVSLALAAGLSNIALRPLEEIGRRLDQMTAGAPDSAPEPELQRTDEFGVVNTKIDRLGRQMRDVKEVFTAMKENLDQLMESLQDGLILFTRDSRVVLVSSSAERFVGRPRNEIFGHTVDEIFKLDGRLGTVVLDAFALHQSVPQREIELPNGQRVQIALDFISERGERIGALLTVRDAESVRRIENEIELSHRLASIGRLTSGVAHEVKNPINAIVVHLELLREKMREASPDTRRHMDIISNEIHRLDRVVQTLVDFNRPVELRLKTTDLRRVLEEVIQLAAPEAEQNGVGMVTQLGNEPLPVLIDYDLVKQALDNVVLNGIQAMTEGGTLRITARRDDKAAAVEIQDAGPGIPPEIRDKIFNLYFTTKKTGSGIGLAMTYRVLQMHHGSLDFDTELGRGSTFRLCLPLAVAGQNPANTKALAVEPADSTGTRS